MKASHHARVLEDGKKRFIFDRIGNDTTTKFSSKAGKLQTHHLCFLCIAAPESRALYKHASYCLIRVDPLTWNPSARKQEIFFIISYNMKTCLGVSEAIILLFTMLHGNHHYRALMTSMAKEWKIEFIFSFPLLKILSLL